MRSERRAGVEVAARFGGGAAEGSGGVAVVDEIQCVRNLGQGCTRCIDKCLIGLDAIELDGDGRIQVIENGCTGCGVCQQYRPTEPRAIQNQAY